MKELLKGKKIAIVGPSQSIIGSNNGELIDSYDFVVRLNHQWPPPKSLIKDIGKRTDIHYDNGMRFQKNIDLLIRNLDSHPLRLFVYDSKITNEFTLGIISSFGIQVENYRPHWNRLNRALNCTNNTGTVAIHHLLSLPITELFITGITFMQEPYYKSYPISSEANKIKTHVPDIIDGHKIEPQFKWFLNKLAKDSRIKCDQGLLNIIKTNGVNIEDDLPDDIEIENIILKDKRLKRKEKTLKALALIKFFRQHRSNDTV